MMCIVVCTGLVKKYNQVMQRYYVQYLSNYDAVCLNSIIQVRHCTEKQAHRRSQSVLYLPGILSVETVLSASMQTRIPTHAPTHMSILTILNVVYTQLKMGSKQRLEMDEG